MKKVLFALSLIGILTAVFVFYLPKQKAQEKNPLKFLQTSVPLKRPLGNNQTPPSAQIRDIQIFGEKSGIAYTGGALFLTRDNGESWREVELPEESENFETISAAYFLNENIGWVILANRHDMQLKLLKTADGGSSWTQTVINIRAEDVAEANLDIIRHFSVDSGNNAEFKLDLPSTANFERYVYYSTKDGGETWEAGWRKAEKRGDERKFDNLSVFWKDMKEAIPDKIELGEIPSDNVIKREEINLYGGGISIKHLNWYLTQSGSCEGFKVGCTQITRIYKDTSSGENDLRRVSYEEITPPQIKQLAAMEKANARLQAGNSVFAAQPPGGATRISLNRGFDKCTAATSAQMQTWWNTSPFYDANIYISGRNRGCAQPQLTAAWVNQVSAMGWGLIPTVVGYQAPCSVCTSCQKHSSDPPVAETQGRGEADIAITDANNLGLTQGTILYYDMERYDDVSGTGACSTPVKAFLKGWTDRLKEQGYVSGVYGSPTNAVGDWLNIPAPSRMDAIWMARWDNVPSVWFYAAPSPMIPSDAWANHQRIKQYQAPHNETWGGVTFNIDGNIADGPVAGVQPARNKTADFDGDGRTDISVFRPEAGAWYVVNSSNSAFNGINFGISTDLLAPGDFDGDGKTDYSVFRPSDGTWYIQLRTTLRAQQFGANGDIPVPADYNGDGFTDIAVFRPTDGGWYIWNSSGSANLLRVEQFGAVGDKPVPGDYDGDGKADIAVFRPSDGTWYLLRSQAGFTGIQFGVASDKPGPADYDGDGKTDLGVYREGTWYLLKSQEGFAGIQFGIATDKPAPGDYDGDNKADLAVFRDGVWYLLRSQAGFTGVQFGVAGDRTIPSAYIPQN